MTGRLIDASAAAAATAATEEVLGAMESPGRRLIMVDSPPGAGKSTLVVALGRRRAELGDRVPVVTQTNDQADDLVRAFAVALADTTLLVGRLHAATDYAVPADLEGDPQVRRSPRIADLAGCAVVVAPGKKWAHVDTADVDWRCGVIDEVYQMRSDGLQEIANLFPSLVAVGDPGQLSPFTTGEEELVRGLDGSPLESAADVLLRRPDAHHVTLPVSWRLTPAAAELVSGAFYNVPFRAGTLPGARALRLRGLDDHDPIDRVLGHAATTGWGMLELPGAYMPTADPGAVDALTTLVRRALTARGMCRDESERLYPLTGAGIAIGVAHREQVRAVRADLAPVLAELGLPRNAVTVDTANRLQGRQFELVLAWHPMSGRASSGSFHVDAGRLCVLLSRHRQACVLVTRAGLRERLDGHPQPDPLWLGERQTSVDGWEANLHVLEELAKHRISA